MADRRKKEENKGRKYKTPKRYTQMTKRDFEAVTEMIANGGTLEEVADSININLSTYFLWIQQGKVDFIEAIEKGKLEKTYRTEHNLETRFTRLLNENDSISDLIKGLRFLNPKKYNAYLQLERDKLDLERKRLNLEHQEKSTLPKLPNIYGAVAECYLDTFYHKAHHHLLKGGRGTAKTARHMTKLIECLVNDVEAEAVIIRQNMTDHRPTSYSECINTLTRLGYQEGIHFTANKSPLGIEFMTGQKIHFKALNDIGKLKGSVPSNGKYFKCIYYFEISEFKGYHDITQSRATFSRGAKGEDILYLYDWNTTPSLEHWTEDFVKLAKENPDDYMYKFTTYQNLSKYEQENWLGKAFMEDIEREKKLNPQIYNHVYLGQRLTLDKLFNVDDFIYVKNYDEREGVNVAMIDPKSTGKDYFSVGVFNITSDSVTLIDTIHTNEVLSKNLIKRVIDFINHYSPLYTFIEVNHGYALALELEEQCNSRVETFHTSVNKIGKIISNSVYMKQIQLLETDDKEYKTFVNQVFDYDCKTNSIDDSTDVMAMFIDKYKMIYQQLKGVNLWRNN